MFLKECKEKLFFPSRFVHPQLFLFQALNRVFLIFNQLIERSQFSSVQFNSVAQSCPTLCDPMNCSMPGLPVHHQLPEFTQTHVHWVSDAIQPSHPLSSPSPPARNPSQHQSLFQWVNSSHEVAKVLEFQLQHHSFQRTPRTDGKDKKDYLTHYTQNETVSVKNCYCHLDKQMLQP